MASASVITSSLRNLSTFLQDHQVSFSNGLLILFTIGGEQIFRFNAFRCPCNHDEAFNYALIFMLVPALILGIIGVAVSNLTWRILHGCQHRSENAANGCCKTTKYLFIAVARAAVVPCAWLFVALLDGNYYACMMAEEPCENESREILHLKSVSQNMAWICLGTLISGSFIVICIVRCCDGVTYIQYKFLNSYTEAEQEQMDKLIQESTKELADSNVKAFITKKVLNKTDWDKISKIPDYTVSEKTEDKGYKEKCASESDSKKIQDETIEKTKIVNFITPLHRWVHEQTELQDLSQKTQDLERKRQEAGEVAVQVEDIL